MENTEYLKAAKAKGAEVGAFVATLKTLHSDNGETIHKAAVQFVNSLPLNDIKFENELQSEFESAAKIALLVTAITGQYTAKDWASVAIYGADLTADQITKAEWDAPFVHRDAVRDAIMRESGKYVTSYDAAQAILKGDN